jgi:O6-methylguanine-DNA--protein-cysteine methyltransferase
VPLVIPCHRVVPAGGGVGNYGLGPERKRKLLESEGATDPSM